MDYILRKTVFVLAVQLINLSVFPLQKQDKHENYSVGCQIILYKHMLS